MSEGAAAAETSHNETQTKRKRNKRNHTNITCFDVEFGGLIPGEM